jgi:hypothetical protein
MPLNIRMKPEGEILMVDVSGRALLADMMDMIDQVAAEMRRSGLRRVLVDQTQVIEQFKFTDHFAIGEKAASLFDVLDRAASVVQQSRRTGTSQNVARRKGAELRVFTSKEEAMAWLTRPAEAT